MFSMAPMFDPYFSGSLGSFFVLSFWPPKGEIKLEEHSLVAGTCVSDLQGSAFRPAPL
jgi:hypothetical protein